MIGMVQPTDPGQRPHTGAKAQAVNHQTSVAYRMPRRQADHPSKSVVKSTTDVYLRIIVVILFTIGKITIAIGEFIVFIVFSSLYLPYISKTRAVASYDPVVN